MASIDFIEWAKEHGIEVHKEPLCYGAMGLRMEWLHLMKTAERLAEWKLPGAEERRRQADLAKVCLEDHLETCLKCRAVIQRGAGGTL